MKLLFRIIFKIFLILTILAGCATTEEIKETDSDELLNQGIALLEEGQYDKAISDYNKAIEINPKDAEAYYNRGYAYGEKGEYDKAISDYTKA
ncbi:MAG: tetratricopeptide repeat protein, partial [Desulfobacterales bacterium]|nr:tetratricopeptide repeat protein [Desulfobacterales bacterium]